jgi:membrane fusion protein (multidrug efflux system)
VSEAKREQIVDTVEALGTLRANEQVTLTALATKTIRAIHFDDSQRVTKGQLLVEMTSAEEAALLDEARAEVKEAQLQYERLIPLRDRGTVPVSTFDERKRNYHTAQARLKATESRLQDLIIVAPFDGVLGLRNVSVGALVSPGTVITTIDDDSVMKLDFSVPSLFLSVLKPDLEIEAKARAFGSRAFNGKVSSVDSRVDEVTRSIVVRAIIPNPEKVLRPGMLMTVLLQKDPREALLIREEAITSLGRVHSVFIVEPHEGAFRARSQKVEIGLRRPGEVEIRSGLNEGDLVVAHGTMQVRSGAPVEIAARLKPDTSIADTLRELAGARS